LSEILHLLREQQKQIDELQQQLKAASSKPD
jgi:predicted transcriptional regulator